MLQRVVVLLAAACLVAVATLPQAATASPLPAAQPTTVATPLHRFKVENDLIGWTGYGLRDGQGRVVVPAQDSGLTPLPNGGWLEDRTGGSHRILDASGKPVTPDYAYLVEVRKGLGTLLAGTQGAPLLGGKGGLVRDDGKVVAKLDYLKLDYMDGSPGLFSFVKDRRFGVLDADGKVVVQPEWDNVKALHGLIRVSRYGKEGIYDSHGKQLAAPEAGVHYALITATSTAIHPRMYQGERQFSPELVTKDASWISRCHTESDSCEVVDASLRPALAGSFKTIKYLPDAKLLLVETVKPVEGKRFALYDDKGSLVARLAVSGVETGAAAQGVLIVTQTDPDNPYRDLYGLMDLHGHWLLKPAAGQIDVLRVAFPEQSLASQASAPPRFVRRVGDGNGNYRESLIGADGKTLLPLKDWQFNEYYPSLGLYVMQLPEGRLGILDGDGNWRIPPFKGSEASNSSLRVPYYEVDTASDGKDQQIVYDLKTGKPLFAGPFQYIDIETSYWPLNDSSPWPDFVVVIATRDGKYGVINLHGDVIVPFKYTNIEAVNRWGQVRATTANGDTVRIDALGPARSGELHARVSRAIREQPSPVPGPGAPYAGRYVPVAYQTGAAIEAAFKGGKLAWAAAPTILADGRVAVLDLDMLPAVRSRHIDFIEYYCPREHGFDVLMPGAAVSADACPDPKAPRLMFTPGQGDTWRCKNCAEYGLPQDWVRQQVAAGGDPQQADGGGA